MRVYEKEETGFKAISLQVVIETQGDLDSILSMFNCDPKLILEAIIAARAEIGSPNTVTIGWVQQAFMKALEHHI